MRRERFAPSPTGRLHLGHAFSALTAWDSAQGANGEFLLRIEDIDAERSRESHVQAIYDDLTWLGLSWPLPVIRQSDRHERYAQALQSLTDAGLCYPCRCTRRDIRNALAAPQESAAMAQTPNSAAHIYPGTCRERSMDEAGSGDAVRLNMSKALAALGGPSAVAKISYTDIGNRCGGRHVLNARCLLRRHGDIVLARRDIKTSYHLSVVVDDSDQGVTHVSRGEDLFGATPIHRFLQALLDLDPPIWNHHRLIRDAAGRRLAKRDRSTAISELRSAGLSPGDIRALVGLEMSPAAGL